MKRLAIVATVFALAVASAVAQSPKGWMVRADRSTNASDPDGAGAIKFATSGSGFHATNPQAAVFWNPATTGSGNYTLKGSFTLLKPSGHNNYYGLVFGGSDLDNAKQTYIYFLVAQDGSFLVKHRAGDAAVHDVVTKTSNDAVQKPDASGKSVNRLEVRVGADKIDYVVNDKVVTSTPKSGMTAKTDGLVGIRVNHLLDVQIDGFGVSK